jgi:hypothetical protein
LCKTFVGAHYWQYKTINQWNDNIIDTKRALISEIQINIPMELNIHGSTHDSDSHGDRAPQFQPEYPWERF